MELKTAGAGGGDERQHGLFALPTAGHKGCLQDERRVARLHGGFWEEGGDSERDDGAHQEEEEATQEEA